MPRPEMFWDFLPTRTCEMPMETIGPSVEECELPAVAEVTWSNDTPGAEPMYVCEKHLRQIIEDEEKVDDRE
jgi:hypothetical protein